VAYKKGENLPTMEEKNVKFAFLTEEGLQLPYQFPYHLDKLNSHKQVHGVDYFVQNQRRNLSP